MVRGRLAAGLSVCPLLFFISACQMRPMSAEGQAPPHDPAAACDCVCPAPPPLVSVAPAPPAMPAAPTDTDVTRWSHDAIDAFDRGDAAALGAVLSVGFLQFEGGSPLTRDEELAMITKRKPGPPQIAQRAWSNERVSLHEPYAVFLGEAKEHASGNDAHGGSDYLGWYTLVWSREGDAYKLALWSWKVAGSGARRDTWNATFRGEGSGFNKDPTTSWSRPWPTCVPAPRSTWRWARAATLCTSRRAAGKSRASTSPTRACVSPATPPRPVT